MHIIIIRENVQSNKNIKDLYFDTNERLDILASNDISGLMIAKILSRDVSAKEHKCYIGCSNGVVDGLY